MLEEQFRGGVPDPGRTIPRTTHLGASVKASPRGFSQHTLSEVGSFEAGVYNGGASGAVHLKSLR